MPNSFCLTLFLPFLYHLLSFSSLWSWESCYHGYGWTMAPTLWKPHTHAHLHMLSVWSNGNHPSRGWVFVRSPSACSSLCPVTITWPPLPLTEMKNITGQKIHVHAQESLCYSHSQLVVKICKDKVLCSYYPLVHPCAILGYHSQFRSAVEKIIKWVTVDLNMNKTEIEIFVFFHFPCMAPLSTTRLLHIQSSTALLCFLINMCLNVSARKVDHRQIASFKGTETDRGESMHTNTHAHTQIRAMVMNRFGPTSPVLFLLLSLSW